ncbi:MAG TPA: YdeI/OmpD-associated family protein [Flavisolibacter sp.]|nr:YdeI/OmpD-associated family protein [Flavisolibacter sp.]
MTTFNATIKRFEKQGEKTGWTYIEIPQAIAEQLKPGCKKTFRVSGKLEQYKIDRVALMPMGKGHFIMALNADMRKGIRKELGATITAHLKADEREVKPPSDFLDCLADEPDALAFFSTLTKGHQLYFGRWIDSAKTETTRTKRIAQAISALAMGLGFPEMIRAGRKVKESL